MKQNRFKLLVIIFPFLLYACSKELKNDKKFIENLSNDVDFDLPLYNESLKVFISKGDTIYATSLRELYFIKDKNYKDFDSFLINAINDNLLSKSDLIKNSEFMFVLDKTVMEDYNNNGLNNLINKYCEKSDSKNKYYILSNLSFNIKQSLMYFFFKNNYYVMLNDHSGKYVLICKI
jgi:hypothetical protein